MSMQVPKPSRAGFLRVGATTWYKDSHSLFDYESTKTTRAQESFSLAHTRAVNLYRRKNSPEVIAVDASKAFPRERADFEFIAHLGVELEKGSRALISVLKASTYKSRLEQGSSDKQKTNESVDSVEEGEEEPYQIVEKVRPGHCDGTQLVPGMTLKLGRIEYYVSEQSDGQHRQVKPMEHSRCFFNDKVLHFEYDPQVKMPPCKICLDDTNSPDNFLFHPCKCKGESGSVHFECLLQWLRIKIKKEVVGGTQHYNFTRFECEVCKAEFCGYVEVARGQQPPVRHEMIGVDKPEGRYLVMESVTEKEKSIMVIQATPEGGIKLGRGHECEIRITDISVSRKHALIRSTPQGFRVLDNNSKFGTLMRREETVLAVGEGGCERVQIGRTLLSLEYSLSP